MVQEDDEYVIEGPTSSHPLPNITLGELLYNNLANNCRLSTPALIDAVSGEQISYRELFTSSCALAQALRNAGHGQGSILSICSENSLEFFIPIIAALYIGATVSPINHTYTEPETKHSLNICKPSLVFCSRAVAPKFLKLRKELAYLQHIVLIDSNASLAGTDNMHEYVATRTTKSEIDRFRVAQFDPDEVIAFVMCSSGTTGLPKGVMQSHTNILVRYVHCLDAQMMDSSSDRFLGILPFFHGYGLVTNLCAIVFAQTVIVLKRFEERTFLRAIEQFRIANLYLAPPLLVFLAKSPLVSEYDLSSIKEIACGSAPLSSNTEETLKKRLNLHAIRQGYGLTEATLAVLIMRLDSKPLPGSSGKVCPLMRVKVRDPETGRSLGPRQTGELCIKGPMVMKGYFGNEKATKESFTSDGWLLTGDLGYYDDEEYFYIIDRLKELIKYKGFQVAPAELEAILIKHPKIRDAGVVGLPREDVGELPVAFIVKAPNVEVTKNEIVDYVDKQVSPQKRLRGGVVFIEVIPRNASGKILRRDLREILKNNKSKL